MIPQPQSLEDAKTTFFTEKFRSLTEIKFCKGTDILLALKNSIFTCSCFSSRFWVAVRKVTYILTCYVTMLLIYFDWCNFQIFSPLIWSWPHCSFFDFSTSNSFVENALFFQFRIIILVARCSTKYAIAVNRSYQMNLEQNC